MPMKQSTFVALLIVVLSAASAIRADAAVMYTSEAAFLSALTPDRYTNDLTASYNQNSLSYSSPNDYAYTIATPPSSTLYWAGNNLSVYNATTPITITFFGKAVTAVGGYFWPTDAFSENTTGTISFQLSDGTIRQVGAASASTFTGFTSGTALTSLTFSAVQSGPGGLYPTMQHLIVGQAAIVPVPSAVWLLGSGLVGLIGMRQGLRRG